MITNNKEPNLERVSREKDKYSTNKIKCDDYKNKTNKRRMKNKPFVIMGTILFSLVIVVLSYYFFVFPSIYLNGEKHVNITYPNTYEEPGFKLKQFGKELTKKIDTKGEVDSTKVGDYTLIYTYNSGFFQKSTKRVVSIIDKESPILTLKGSKEVSVCPNQKYQEEGYTAEDNYDGNLTDKVKIKEEGNSIFYEVSDSSKNISTDKRVVTYQDVDGPKITLKGTSTIYLQVGTKYQESGADAVDSCEGDLTEKMSITGNVDTNVAGTYLITYKAKDSLGHETIVNRKVIVSKTINAGTSKPGVIYLTFDDGPNATHTTKILDVLKKYNVKATFFVTMSGPDSLILREHQEGHVIALHTATHNYQTVYSSVDAYFNDLQTVSNRVKKITGVESKIIRFPGGSSNTISAKYSKGIMSTLTKEVLNRGYRYYDWNISSGDAGGTTSSQGVYQGVIKSLSKTRGNMVLMHDVKAHTAAAIEDIIKYGLNNGYTFEVIDMSTDMFRQKVNN